MEQIIRTGERREIHPGGIRQGREFKVPRLELKKATIVTQCDIVNLMASSPQVLPSGMFCTPYGSGLEPSAFKVTGKWGGGIRKTLHVSSLVVPLCKMNDLDQISKCHAESKI